MKLKRSVVVGITLAALSFNGLAAGPAAHGVAGRKILKTAPPASSQGEHGDDRHDRDDDHRIRHVLLISVDGMHSIDLANCVSNGGCPNIAKLSQTGLTYHNASTTNPSDSYPGLTAQITGGLPQTTGIWYDDHWDRTLFPAGSNCLGTPGTEYNSAEPLDYDPNALDGGASAHGGVAIDPSKLPLAPDGCVPAYPHNVLRVNTIFEVVKGHGMRTAWADKHPAYDLVNGPSGTGVCAAQPCTTNDELYTPEVNSLVPIGTCNGDGAVDWTGSECAVQMNDELKVQAVLNEINGLDHSGKVMLGVPNVFGMNFQAVSVGQKLKSDYQLGAGGYTYVAGVITPGPALTSAISFVDTSIGKMVTALKSQDILDDTLIIVSAKHGQSPIDVSKKKALDASLIATIVGAPYAFDISDDATLLWLRDQSKTSEVVETLSSPANQDALGIQEIFAGNLMKVTWDDPLVDPKTPDIILKVNTGVIFTAGSKISEHGGSNEDDLHVALLLSNPHLHAGSLTTPVQTKQIAPTILKALGLSPSELQAVRIEHTAVLPGLFVDSN